MAIIPTVGRKTLKMRLVIALLYIVLTAGAVTMVYPFLLMLSSSITSNADQNTYSVVPRYIYNNDALFCKYVDDRYAGDIDLINQYYNQNFAKVDQIVPPKINSGSKQLQAQALDWNKFLNELPLLYKQASFEGYGQSPSRLRNAYRDFCRKRFHNDISKLNKAYLEENTDFDNVTFPFDRFKMREWEPDNSIKMREWLKFKQTIPAYFMRPIIIDPTFKAFLRDGVYNGRIADLNASWRTNYKDFSEAHLSSVIPDQPGQRKDWEKFVREMLPFRYMHVSPEAVTSYRAFLKSRYKGSISSFNSRHMVSLKSFDDIKLPTALPKSGAPLVDWMDFIAKRIPPKMIIAENTENLYREHLKKQFGSLEAINKAFGTNYTSLDSIMPPIYNADWYRLSQDSREIRGDFITRNYVMVFNYIVLHGRAVLNTFIFVFAVIIIHLIVNPMCAYALSRYNLPYAYKVLLFLLATMAFPAEVAMIPSFLLLKQFHLLNTYWALILPGVANGYAIFLLKGFFDSLPKELYEAGIIDGASETTMFRKITIPMSKPIFAVIALQSFTGAYGAFMYAMLVCQDPKMWTLMVWLYQLQTTAPQYITMAALAVAALPTLLVFIFAQNVIMRGIIIPSYK